MQTSSPTHFWVLHACICSRSACWGPGHLPLARIGRSTCRSRFCRPPPHAMEQGSQAVHSKSVQSRSHDPVLQDLSSMVVSHSFPPFLGLTRMARVRPWVPPPHSLEQPEKPLHSDIEHATGHLCWLHFFVMESVGQGMPTGLGAIRSSRTRFCVPPQAWTLTPPTSAGQLSSQSTEHISGRQSLKSQSLIISGGVTLLYSMSLLRTTRTAQMFVNRISVMRSWHSFIFFLYVASRSRCCCSFSRVSAESEFISETASPSISWCFVLLARSEVTCSFRLSRSWMYSSLLRSIKVVSSSTRSLNLPHCSAIVSWRKPQSTLWGVLHFFHWLSEGGSFDTGTGGGAWRPAAPTRPPS
mmetsp:Transcript_103531/g.278291  ORF Transcript_103531/g.278291 Transcript_103531/m.278291 type:complete len:355 (+) Transcript_103531:1062-2126(+)